LLLRRVLRLTGTRPLEAALLDERQDARQLAGVEPGAVLLAHVDDHAARSAEVLAIHQGGALRARAIVHRLYGARPARHRLAALLVALEQIAQRGVLDELSAAHGAVVQRARTEVEHLEG